MKFHENKLLTAVAAAALTFAVAACSSNGDDDDAMSAAPDAGAPDTGAPDTGAPAPLSELAAAQADAAAAATAAMTASGEAATAAAAAMTAVANLATMQTEAKAGGLADDAQTAAGKAMAAYMDAKAASEAAAAAEDVTAAVEARIMAEEASANAVMYAMTASEKGTAAETAAMAELMIDGKDKNVGDDTSVNADAGSSVITTDGDTVTTGRIKTMDPMTTGAGVPTGVPFEAEEAPTADTAYVQQVAPRDLTIGRTLDTSDDTARLMLVTHYAGTKMVSVYGQGSDTAMGTKAGYVSLDDDVQDNGDDTNNVALKSEGTYYRAGTGTGNNLTATDEVADDAEGVEVLSYVDPNANNNAGRDKTYVVLTTESTTAGTTTYTYTEVDVTALASDATLDGTAEQVQVRAAIPEATEYKHIHFGVWAALGAPAKSGLQELSDLGIGFVQSIGDGLSGADMPNNGGANYSGNWAAAVQAADEDGDGGISLVHGDVTLDADFSKATIEATLTGLATLEGTVDTNTFSGTKATVMADDPHGLDSDGKFTGSFSGGFYGKQAAEAGGIFDFTSEDAEAGAFRGAFGGDRN